MNTKCRKVTEEKANELDCSYGGWEDYTRIYEFFDDSGTVMGYAYLTEYDDNVFVNNIRVTTEGVGYGRKLLKEIFEMFNNKNIEGYAILEPSAFWEAVGASFEYPATEDSYDGERFVLTNEEFIKRFTKTERRTIREIAEDKLAEIFESVGLRADEYKIKELPLSFLQELIDAGSILLVQ